MSALSIQPPFPIFTGIDGQPLENGYVWIGVANLDPEGNPITVYWDEALTIPAPQPIRTVSGYPARAGSPARLYVNSDYSIRVLDKNGTLVYGAPESTELLSSAFITFVQSGAGTVERTVQAKLRETVSVKDFGAVGDGVMDDTAAIQSAINATSFTGARLYIPAGDWLINNSIELKDNTFIYGDGYATKLIYSGNGYAMHNPNKLTTTASRVCGENFAIFSANGNGLDTEGLFEFTFEAIYLIGNTSSVGSGTIGVHTGWSAGSSGQPSWWGSLHIIELRGFDTGWLGNPNSNALKVTINRIRQPMAVPVYLAPPSGVNVSSGIDITILDIGNNTGATSVFCDARNVRLWMRHEASNSVAFHLGANHRSIDATWSSTAANVTQIVDGLYVDGVVRSRLTGAYTYKIQEGYRTRQLGKNRLDSSTVDPFRGSALNTFLWAASGTGSATLIDSTSGTGAVRIATGATATNDYLIKFGVAPIRTADRSPSRFIARVRLNTLTGVLAQFGFARNTATFPLDATQSGVWFENNASGSAEVWRAAQANGSTLQSSASTVTATVATLIFQIDMDRNGRGKFYIDGNLVADLSATGGNNGVPMTPFFYIKTAENSAKNIEVETFVLEPLLITFV
jgi:hypothetical protein